MILKKSFKILTYALALVLAFILAGLGLHIKNGEGKTISGKAADLLVKETSASHNDGGWWGGDCCSGDDGDGDDDGVSGATLLRSENSTR